MKRPIHILAALAGLGITAIHAQQPADKQPPARPAPSDDKPRPQRAPESTKRPPPGAERESEPKMQKVAYIGVMTREVPPELRSQFGLSEGFGLLVDGVMPDSPASAAGIKEHDILVRFEDQRLVNIEQLMALVRSRSKGDSVSLIVITGGKETPVTITLAERDMPVADQRREPHPMQMFSWPQVHSYGFHDRMPPGGMQEQVERARNAMQEYQERIQEWARNGQKGPMPSMPRMPGTPRPENENDPRREGGRPGHHEPGHGPEGGRDAAHTETHASVHIVRRDDSGEYALKREDGKSTFTARPKDGKEQSWPASTDEERAAIPAELREKLRMFDNMPRPQQDMKRGDAPERSRSDSDKPKPRPATT